MGIHLRTVQFENVHEILGNKAVMRVGKMSKEVIVLNF